MTLKQILSKVRRHLPPSFDVENIACDLWMQAWERHRKGEQVAPALDPPLSRDVIHNRCVDELRKTKNQVIDIDHFRRMSEIDRDEESLDAEKVVSDLLVKSSLSLQEKKIIIERFYLGRSLKLIARHLLLTEHEVSAILNSVLERLRAVARETKGKES